MQNRFIVSRQCPLHLRPAMSTASQIMTRPLLMIVLLQIPQACMPLTIDGNE